MATKITIHDYLTKAKFVKDNVKTQTEKIVQKNEKLIIQLNINQFVDGYGSDDKRLFNVRPEYDGVYAPEYKKQGLYNFWETGAFIKGMKIDFGKNINDIRIYSTGTGTGEKSLFFAGYTNLFGLDSKSRELLNKNIMLPKLQEFISKYL
jgi:hypothetical protein